MRDRASRTLGEQASVFSLKSRRSAARLPGGGGYSFIHCTRARGEGLSAGTESVAGLVKGPPCARAFTQAGADGFGVGGEALGFGEQYGPRAQRTQGLRTV